MGACLSRPILTLLPEASGPGKHIHALPRECSNGVALWGEDGRGRWRWKPDDLPQGAGAGFKRGLLRRDDKGAGRPYTIVAGLERQLKKGLKEPRRQIRDAAAFSPTHKRDGFAIDRA